MLHSNALVFTVNTSTRYVDRYHANWCSLLTFEFSTGNDELNRDRELYLHVVNRYSRSGRHDRIRPQRGCALC